MAHASNKEDVQLTRVPLERMVGPLKESTYRKT
jgi:hypothetical protein